MNKTLKLIKLIIYIAFLVISFSFQRNTNHIEIKNIRNANNLYLMRGKETLCYNLSDKLDGINFPRDFKPEIVILTFKKKCLRFEIPYENPEENISGITIERNKLNSYIAHIYYNRLDCTTKTSATFLKFKKDCNE